MVEDSPALDSFPHSLSNSFPFSDPELIKAPVWGNHEVNRRRVVLDLQPSSLVSGVYPNGGDDRRSPRSRIGWVSSGGDGKFHQLARSLINILITNWAETNQTIPYDSVYSEKKTLLLNKKKSKHQIHTYDGVSNLHPIQTRHP